MSELAILSLIVALILTEATGIVPGGIIVPFYFALYIDDPVKIISTIICALLTMFLVWALEHVMILYGRKKFAVYVILGLLLKLLSGWLYYGNSYQLFSLSLTIGYLVPGIMGRQMERQGILKTLLLLAVAVLFICLISVIFTQG